MHLTYMQLFICHWFSLWVNKFPRKWLVRIKPGLWATPLLISVWDKRSAHQKNSYKKVQNHWDIIIKAVVSPLRNPSKTNLQTTALPAMAAQRILHSDPSTVPHTVQWC